MREYLYQTGGREKKTGDKGGEKARGAGRRRDGIERHRNLLLMGNEINRLNSSKWDLIPRGRSNWRQVQSQLHVKEKSFPSEYRSASWMDGREKAEGGKNVCSAVGEMGEGRRSLGR